MKVRCGGWKDVAAVCGSVGAGPEGTVRPQALSLRLLDVEGPWEGV